MQIGSDIFVCPELQESYRRDWISESVALLTSAVGLLMFRLQTGRCIYLNRIASRQYNVTHTPYKQSIFLLSALCIIYRFCLIAVYVTAGCLPDEFIRLMQYVR